MAREVLDEGAYRVVFTRGVADPGMAGLRADQEQRPVVLLYATGATRHSTEVGAAVLDLPVPLPDAENGTVGTLVHGDDATRAHVRVAGQVVPLAKPPTARDKGVSMLAGQLASSDVVHPRHAGRSSVAAWVTERAGRGAEEGDRDLSSFARAIRHPALLTAGLVLMVVVGVAWSVFEITSGTGPGLSLAYLVPASIALWYRIRESRRRRTAVKHSDRWRDGTSRDAQVAVWWSPGTTGGVVPWAAAVFDDRALVWPVVGRGVADLVDGPYDAVVRGEVGADEPWLAIELDGVLLEPVEPARGLAHVGCTPTEVAGLDGFEAVTAGSDVAWPE